MLTTCAGATLEGGEIRLEGRERADAEAPGPIGLEATGIDPARSAAVCDCVIDLIAVFFNVSGRQLRSPRRTTRAVARVRQVGMYVSHVTLGMTMTAVGAGFGRDKSTVVHACHTIEDMRDDEDFDLIVARVERLVTVAFSMDRTGAR